MTQRQKKQITKSDNLLILIGSTIVLPGIILKFRHLKYKRRRNLKHQSLGTVFFLGNRRGRPLLEFY
jgi:hypothetical protein